MANLTLTSGQLALVNDICSRLQHGEGLGSCETTNGVFLKLWAFIKPAADSVGLRVTKEELVQQPLQTVMRLVQALASAGGVSDQFLWEPSTVDLLDYAGVSMWNAASNIPGVTSLTYLGAKLYELLDIEHANSLVTFTAPNLTDMGTEGFIFLQHNNALTTATFLGLVTCYSIQIKDNPALTSVFFTEFVPDALTLPGGQIIDLSGNALSEDSVDEMLARCVASADFTGGQAFLYLDGGTNSPPSVAGGAYVAALQGRGVTLAVNP